MITDTLKNADLYPMGEAWSKAFKFLRTLDAKSPDGEYPIHGESLFARVMSYETKPPAEARFEAHRRFADIQSTLDGAEGIGIANVNDLTADGNYDETTDLIFYETPQTVPALIDVYPGSFAFLLPQDAHMPQLEVNSPRLIKKVVVKIALSELNL